MGILVNFLERLTSRKFLTSAAAFIIVLLDGLGVGQFTAEVLAGASATLLSYVFIQGGVDLVKARNGE